MNSPNNWFVLTGGPNSGKTTIIEELDKLGYKTVPEAARMYIDKKVKRGLKVGQIRNDEKYFQQQVIKMKIRNESELEPKEITFLDRGMHDTEAYLKLFNLTIEAWVSRAIKMTRYKKVFLLETLPNYQKDYARTESIDHLKKLTQLLYNAYSNAKMQPVVVPPLNIIDRVKFILSHVDSRQVKKMKLYG